MAYCNEKKSIFIHPFDDEKVIEGQGTVAKEILEGYGYTTVRSAKSGGIFDLVGFNDKKFILVQVKICKTGKIPTYKQTREDIKQVQVPKNCKKELWVKERRKGWHYFVL